MNNTKILRKIQQELNSLDAMNYCSRSFKAGYLIGHNEKKQTKKDSAFESVVNIVVGLITSFIIQLVIYPLLNIEVSINQNVIITFVFFVVSFIRGYLIRRYFNKK